MTSSSAPPVGPRPVAHTLALLQPWIDFVPQKQRRLGVFICCALAAHIAAFFFIRIDATRAEIQRPDLTHLTMEDSRAGTSAGMSDSFLDSLADPRFFLLPTLPIDHLSVRESGRVLADMNSNLGTDQAPPPAAGPAEQPILSVPAPSLAEEVTATLNPSRQAFVYDESAPLPPNHTTWEWDPAFATRLPAQIPGLPSPVSDTDVNPTELQVALGPDGTVEHVLLENSSQKPDLDQQAILALRKMRFEPGSATGDTWGRVTVYWHATAPPPEVVVPTPPTAQ